MPLPHGSARPAPSNATARPGPVRALAAPFLAACLLWVLCPGAAGAASRTLDYGYDPAGRLALVSYGGGVSQAYSHDQAGNLRRRAYVSDDADGDGLSDSWESAHGQGDPNADGDQDGLNNLQEALAGTDPAKADSDGDGYTDGAEFQAGSDPLNAASTPAGWRALDLSILFQAAENPVDSLPDAWEMGYFGNLKQTDGGDPDGDGLSNLAEYQRGTDPTKADSDGDGFSDGDEVAAGTDPLDPASRPRWGLSWLMMLLK